MICAARRTPNICLCLQYSIRRHEIKELFSDYSKNFFVFSFERGGGSADPVFDPTLAFIRFPEDLHLNYAMITARCSVQLTWVLLPVAGLDFQPQTRAAAALNFVSHLICHFLITPVHISIAAHRFLHLTHQYLLCHRRYRLPQGRVL